MSTRTRLVFTHHFDSARVNGAFRSEARVAPPVPSLWHYCIITPNTSLQVECFCLFFYYSNGSIWSGIHFSYEHLSRSALFMETHQPRLAQLFSAEEGDTADTASGAHGLPGRGGPVLTAVSLGMDYWCAVTSWCGRKAFRLINVQCVCVWTRYCIRCAQVFLPGNICRHATVWMFKLSLFSRMNNWNRISAFLPYYRFWAFFLFT